MRNTNGIIALSFSLAVALLAGGFSADAQRKSKKNIEILDGSAVNIGQSSPSTPVEQKLKEKNRPGIDFAPTKTVYLYPKGQSCDQGIVENGVTVTLGPLASNGLEGPEKANPYGFISNVTDSARIDIFIPDNPNGQMVVAAPGGGYGSLSTWNEGMYMAKWLNDRGIACAVLKYRLPNGHNRIPLQDAQNAFRYCRFHSKEWGVRQIGIAGFSAGGHLASTVETMYVDSITKPDFAILCYPVISMDERITNQGTENNLIGDNVFRSKRDIFSFDQWRGKEEDFSDLVKLYSTQNDITLQTPPSFIALSSDDALVQPINSVLFYKSLVKSKVPVELHIYPRGNHGWGFTDLSSGLDPSVCKDNLGSCRPEFSSALERWLSGLDGKSTKGTETKSSNVPVEPDQTVFLYPEGQKVDKGIEGITLGPGESNGASGPEVFGKDNNLRNVGDSARFDLYLAKNPNGKMVVICPGGAYWFTAVVHEGKYAAQWLNSQGISAAVVKYRLPYGHWTVPLTDVQNVFRYCRSHAGEWGVNKIGVMGFSAGGHLAASASTLYVDQDTRPDFSVLVYPVISSEPGVRHEGTFNNLLGVPADWMKRPSSSEDGESSYSLWIAKKNQYKNLLERYSLDKQVSPDTPPTFIIFSSNDGGVPPENEIRYYNALLDAGVVCEMHSFPGGGHGYGFKSIQRGDDPIQPYREDFLSSMARFLREL